MYVVISVASLFTFLTILSFFCCCFYSNKGRANNLRCLSLRHSFASKCCFYLLFLTSAIFLLLEVFRLKSEGYGSEEGEVLEEGWHGAHGLKQVLLDGRDLQNNSLEWGGFYQVREEIEALRAVQGGLQETGAAYDDFYNNERVSLDFIQSRIDQINAFIEVLQGYKNKQIINFQENFIMPKLSTLQIFSSEWPPTIGDRTGYVNPYYPLELEGTALYNISQTFNQTVLDRLYQLQKIQQSGGNLSQKISGMQPEID